MSNTVEIKFDYTPKSIAIFGNTKPYSEIIKEKGGKFNPSLNYGTEDEPDRKPGWIFPSSKRSIVEQLVNDINNGSIKSNNSSSNSNTKSSSSSSNNSTSKSNYQHDYVERKAFMVLISRIEKLEQEVALLTQKFNNNSNSVANNNSKKTVIEFNEDNSEDEESNNEENSDDDTPIPSLLKAKKQHK